MKMQVFLDLSPHNTRELKASQVEAAWSPDPGNAASWRRTQGGGYFSGAWADGDLRLAATSQCGERVLCLPSLGEVQSQCVASLLSPCKVETSQVQSLQVGDPR